MSTIANLDWKRIGMDAAVGTAGLVVGGPVGAGAGVFAAEALQHLSRTDAPEDTDDAQTPEG